MDACGKASRWQLAVNQGRLSSASWGMPRWLMRARSGACFTGNLSTAKWMNRNRTLIYVLKIEKNN
jgi:hypothetical protein